MNTESFSKRLRRIRVKRGISMKQMAEKIQVPLSTYREWEYGRAIKGEPYERIAHALSVSLSELLTGRLPQSSALTRELAALEHHLALLRKEIEMHF